MSLEELKEELQNREIDLLSGKWEKKSKKMVEREDLWIDRIYNAKDDRKIEMLRVHRDRDMKNTILHIYDDLLKEIDRRKLPEEKQNSGTWKNNYNFQASYPNKELESKTKVKREILMMQEQDDRRQNVSERKNEESEPYKVSDLNKINPAMQTSDQLGKNILLELGVNEKLVNHNIVSRCILDRIVDRAIEKGVLKGNEEGRYEIYNLKDTRSVENLISEMKNDNMVEIDEKGNILISNILYSRRDNSEGDIRKANRNCFKVDEDGLIEEKNYWIYQSDQNYAEPMIFGLEEYIFNNKGEALYCQGKTTEIAPSGGGSGLRGDGNWSREEEIVKKRVHKDPIQLLKNMENWDNTMWSECNSLGITEAGRDYIEKEKILQDKQQAEKITSQEKQQESQAIPSNGIFQNLLHAYDVVDITKENLETAMQTIRGSLESIRSEVKTFFRQDDELDK